MALKPGEIAEHEYMWKNPEDPAARNKIVKIMYFDEPAGKVTGQSDWAHHALLAISALFISPLGYLLTRWLGDMADAAAAALFLNA